MSIARQPGDNQRNQPNQQPDRRLAMAFASRFLAVSLAASIPLRSALLLPARAARRRPLLIRAQSAAARSPAPPDTKDFLVRNKRNDVQVLSCPSPAVLEQGLLELSSEPHICVAGESNAGKSSLINHLLVKSNLARASSVAGKTKAVDLMLVNQRLVLADLPGLPSRDHQVEYQWETSWRPLVLEYVRRCGPLRAMLYVHDVRWKVSSLCRDFLADIQEAGVPVILILTKDDRLEARGTETQHTLRVKQARRIKNSLGLTDSVHLHYSVDNSLPASRKARRQLLRYIESLAAADDKDECSELLSAISAKKRGDPQPAAAQDAALG